jgi:hypothetical protein
MCMLMTVNIEVDYCTKFEMRKTYKIQNTTACIYFERQYSLFTMMPIAIYLVITMLGKYPGISALRWHFQQLLPTVRIYRYVFDNPRGS